MQGKRLKMDGQARKLKNSEMSWPIAQTITQNMIFVKIALLTLLNGMIRAINLVIAPLVKSMP